MKKLFFYILGATALLGFTRCEDDDYIWDFVNYSVEIKVLDAESNVNLLDPEVEGNILGQEIVLNYNGKVYQLKREGDQTRANPALWNGLVLHPNGTSVDNESCLSVGQFTTGGTVNRPFTIDWGDGSKTEFVVTSDVKDGSSKNPTIIRSLTVDGKPVAHEEGKNWKVTILK